MEGNKEQLYVHILVFLNFFKDKRVIALLQR